MFTPRGLLGLCSVELNGRDQLPALENRIIISLTSNLP